MKLQKDQGGAGFALLICTSLLTASCAAAKPNPQLAGVWRSEASSLTLSKEGAFERILVNLQNPFLPPGAKPVSQRSQGKWEERQRILYLNAGRGSAREAYRWELKPDGTFESLTLTPLDPGGRTQIYVRLASHPSAPPPPVSPADPVESAVKVSVERLAALWAPAFAAKRIQYRPPVIVRSDAEAEFAHYDPAANAIVYGYPFFQRQLQRGEYGATLVIAHEWGHLLQHQLTECETLEIEMELQADCFMGVYAKSERLAGRFSETGLTAALLTVLDLGDPVLPRPSGHGFDRHRLGEHGSSMKRDIAFKRGLQTGTPGCACEAMKRLGAEAF